MGAPPPYPWLLFSNDKKVAKKSLKIGGHPHATAPPNIIRFSAYTLFCERGVHEWPEILVLWLVHFDVIIGIHCNYYSTFSFNFINFAKF